MTRGSSLAKAARKIQDAVKEHSRVSRHYNIDLLEEIDKVEKAVKRIENMERQLKRLQTQITIALMRLSIWLYAELEAREVEKHGKKD